MQSFAAERSCVVCMHTAFCKSIESERPYCVARVSARPRRSERGPRVDARPRRSQRESPDLERVFFRSTPHTIVRREATRVPRVPSLPGPGGSTLDCAGPTHHFDFHQSIKKRVSSDVCRTGVELAFTTWYCSVALSQNGCFMHSCLIS